MKKLICYVLFFVFGLLLSSCATIVSGKKDIDIRTSTNDTVMAKIENGQYSQDVMIPIIYKPQKRSKDIVITVKESEKYKTTTTYVKSKFNPWFFGNSITGGLLGSTTDGISGAAWKYDKTVIVPLENK